jgi:hypothetical protein
LCWFSQRSTKRAQRAAVDFIIAQDLKLGATSLARQHNGLLDKGM